MDKDMKNAKTDFTPVEIKNLNLNVRRGNKTTEGGCNHCTNRDSYEEVNIIELRSMSLRLCDKCSKMLKKLL